MNNIPQIKVGIVAVSRDCFPIELSINRRKALVDAYIKKYNKEDIYECPICIFYDIMENSDNLLFLCLTHLHNAQRVSDVVLAGFIKLPFVCCCCYFYCFLECTHYL